MMVKGKRRPKTKKAPNCPECGAAAVIPVVHGIPTAALKKAIEAGNAMISNREEWEGLTEWYCKSCGCDWSGRWRRFKRGGAVNSTH